MEDKTIKIVAFGIKNDPKVYKDGGQREVWKHSATNIVKKLFWLDFGAHFGSQNVPKLKPEVTKKGNEKTTPKTEGSVLHFDAKSDQKGLHFGGGRFSALSHSTTSLDFLGPHGKPDYWVGPGR